MLGFFKKFCKCTLPWKPTKIINMWEHKGWGDSVCGANYESREIYGFSTPYLYDTSTEIRSKMESGKIARFKIISIEYKIDPYDMFFAKVKDLGYLEDLE